MSLQQVDYIDSLEEKTISEKRKGGGLLFYSAGI
jgi:hypothetical protein